MCRLGDVVIGLSARQSNGAVANGGLSPAGSREDTPEMPCKIIVKLNAHPGGGGYSVKQKFTDPHRYSIGILGVVSIWGDKAKKPKKKPGKRGSR